MQVFNVVIDELVTVNGITVTPPVLYYYFEANQDQYSDNIHPNGIGYQSLANQWFSVIP